MRTNLSVEDLGTFLDEPRVAVLATLRVDGAVLLSSVYHEWREGAFNVVIDHRECEGSAPAARPQSDDLGGRVPAKPRCVASRSEARHSSSTTASPKPRAASWPGTAMRKPRLTRRPAEARM